MFREMRRKKQLLPEAEAVEILKNCSSGVLSVTGDDDYPYAVPVSYTYKDGSIFIHCAMEGHKIDGIKRNDKVTFCVIGRDDVVKEEFTTRYRSVIAFGRAGIITDDKRKRFALESLVEKYSSGFFKEGQKEIEKAWNHVCMLEIKIEHLTGKASKEIYQ
jgi:nitroimidazol reductase NimA-like FMN-containing flavoprotein (pyridoxamine 5'-phosphate oxidase superfamily)